MTKRHLRFLAALGIWSLVLLLPIVARAQPLPADVCAALTEARSAYGTMLPADQGRVLNGVAVQFAASGLGLSRKTAGTRCPSPAGNIACDILQYRGTETLYDVFVGSAQSVSCQQVVAYHNDPVGRPWVAPVDSGGSPTPTPPAPTPIDLARIEAAVAALTARVQALEAPLEQARFESTNAAIRALEVSGKVDLLLARPLPSCPAIDWTTAPWPSYTMRSPWGIGTFVLRPVVQ